MQGKILLVAASEKGRAQTKYITCYIFGVVRKYCSERLLLMQMPRRENI